MMQEVGNVILLTGDTIELLRCMPDQSVHCVVTSPPYYGLRDYGTAAWEGGDPACDHKPPDEAGATNKPTEGQRAHAGRFSGPTCWKCGARRIDSQLGLEKTPQEYVDRLTAIFREVRRVLRDDGTVWLNLGDSYAGSWGNQGRRSKRGTQRPINMPMMQSVHDGLKPKDLVGIPWRVAFALQADGWYLRSDIIWNKPNVMPSSVKDRCTSSHEYIFMLTKNERYYYDSEAIKEPAVRGPAGSKFNTSKTAMHQLGRSSDKPRKQDGHGRQHAGFNGRYDFEHPESGRNKRDVWTVTTKPFKGAHFATFPPDLIEPCILAGTSAMGACPHCGAGWKRVVEKGAPDLEHQIACGGDVNGEYDGGATKDYAVAGAQDASATKARILAGMVQKVTTGWVPACRCPAHEPVPCVVLDPFGGSGTTGLVAEKHGRRAVLMELNPEYTEIAVKRLTAGLVVI